MGWRDIPILLVAAVGATGFLLMMAAFVLIAVKGGWNKAIQQPIAEGRWPLPRRLMMIGAAMGVVFGIGIVVLRLIPGGIPWID